MNTRKHFGGFNTGRQYTANGQRIFWEVTDTGDINFADIDRMIYGTLTQLQDTIPQNRQVMAEYDAGRYHMGPIIDVPEDFDFGASQRI